MTTPNERRVGGGLLLLMSRCARTEATWLMTRSQADKAVVVRAPLMKTKGEVWCRELHAELAE